jgi:hypothetical protein
MSVTAKKRSTALSSAEARRPLSSRRDTETTTVFLLDNFDSFTYSLVQYLGELGQRSRSIATTS